MSCTWLLVPYLLEPGCLLARWKVQQLQPFLHLAQALQTGWDVKSIHPAVARDVLIPQDVYEALQVTGGSAGLLSHGEGTHGKRSISSPSRYQSD
jgi:hypothetical protein